MSRIGKAPIQLPTGVSITTDEANVVTVKGPRGVLTRQIAPGITLSIEEGLLHVKRPNDTQRYRAFHGLYRALIANMVKGVSEGFKKQLELVGVGYRATATDQVLELAVGYSHPVVILLPKEIKVTATMEKGKNPTVVLECNDNEFLGLVAAKIRSIRKPEPYKGKGIRLSDEHIRRKAGKTASKK